MAVTSYGMQHIPHCYKDCRLSWLLPVTVCSIYPTVTRTAGWGGCYQLRYAAYTPLLQGLQEFTVTSYGMQHIPHCYKDFRSSLLPVTVYSIYPTVTGTAGWGGCYQLRYAAYTPLLQGLQAELAVTSYGMQHIPHCYKDCRLSWLLRVLPLVVQNEFTSELEVVSINTPRRRQMKYKSERMKAN